MTIKRIVCFTISDYCRELQLFFFILLFFLNERVRWDESGKSEHSIYYPFFFQLFQGLLSIERGSKEHHSVPE